MGAGEGFRDGVQMAGQFLMPAMQMKNQNARFDKQLGQQDKQFYDRLVLDQAWKDGFYGSDSPISGAVRTDGTGQPYQTTRPEARTGFMSKVFGSGETASPAAALAFADPVNPAKAPAFADPVNPAAAPARRPFPSPGGGPSFKTQEVMPNQGGPRIGPNTPLPPASSMLRPFRRGY